MYAEQGRAADSQVRNQILVLHSACNNTIDHITPQRLISSTEFLQTIAVLSRVAQVLYHKIMYCSCLP